MDNRSVEIVINAKDMASATLGKISGELKAFGAGASQFLGGAVQTASRVAVAGLLGVGAAAYSTVKDYEESEAAAAQLNAVLKSTKGVAGVTAQAATDMASSLQKVTKYSDEAVLGAENMLLTFTNIGKDVFPDTTKAVLDMSTAMGTDLKSTSIQVGKALQDPVLGVTALQRVGVRLTDSQKELVKQMVATGDVAGAQKLILKELQTEFGGSAEAAGQTFAGKLEILKNQFGELKETVGKFIVGALQPLVSKMVEFVQKVDMTAVLDNIKKKFAEVAKVLKPFLDPITEFMKQHADQIKEFLKTFAISLAVLIPLLALVGLAISVFTNPLVLIALAIAGLIAIWQVWGDQIMNFYNTAIVPLWNLLVTIFKPSLEALADTVMNRLWPAIKQLWDALMPGLWTAIKVIAAVIGAVVVAAIWIFINVLNIVISVISWVISVVAQLISWFGSLVGAIINVANFFRAVWATIFGIVGYYVGAVINKAAEMTQGIRNWVGGLVGWFGDTWNKIGNAISNGISSGMNAAKGIVTGGVNWVVDKLNSLINAANNVAGKVPGVPKIPNIPRLATGTQFFSGGLAMVGENGPELVAMPRGSRVYNAQETRAAGGNATNTFYGDIKLGDASAVREFFDKIGRNQELASMGLTTIRT